MKNIFVYGTLKKGYHNNSVLGDSELIKEHIISGFKLFESGIPYLVPSDNPKDEVLGELYEVVDDRILQNLDRLEGHPNFYKRTTIVTEGEYSDPIEMETYIYQGRVPRTESPKVNGVYVYGRERNY